MNRASRLALNDRAQAGFDELDRVPVDVESSGSSLLVQTTLVGTYPTTASAFYAVQEIQVTGDEVEGGAAAYTAVGGVFYAWNRGAHVPPEGTPLLADVVGDRWTIEY